MNGLLVLGLLVLVGMGATSVIYQWKSPQIVRDRQAVRASMPEAPEPRLDKWLEFGSGTLGNIFEQ